MNSRPRWIGDFTSPDRDAINALRSGQMNAIERGGPLAYAALCADNVILMLQGKEPIQGRRAFIETESRLFESVRFTRIRQWPFMIERSGDLAFEAGLQEVGTDNRNRSSADYLSRRKYLHVLRKTTEGWRFAVLMSSNSE